MEAGLGGRPEVGVRGLLQLADEEPQAHLTVETQEAARLAFNPAQEFRESMLTFRSNLLCTFPTSQVEPVGEGILRGVDAGGVCWEDGFKGGAYGGKGGVEGCKSGPS